MADGTKPLDPDLNHPRPQLRRPDWRDLSGTWAFAFDDGDVGISQRWPDRPEVFDREIEVPYPFESPASGIHDPGAHPVVWYRREVSARPRAGHRLLLHFGAVDYRAAVWVNGVPVAAHEGGHTPFTADLTHVADPSGTQVLVVRADDVPDDLRQPRGKQGWWPEEHTIWYHRTTGIWQPAWLEDVPEVSIERIRWVADVASGSLEMSATVRGRLPEGLRLRVVLRRAERILLDDSYTVLHRETTRRFVLSMGDPTLGDADLLWSPERPNLLDATLTLTDASGARLDQVESYTALRSVSTRGDSFLLNGKPYFLRMVLAQNYWPESHLAAPGAGALRREVENVKSLGFNGLRLHQKIEDPRFLAWCDRLGLLVWGEMPSAYAFSPVTAQRLAREWLEVLERDANHPCIVAWVPFNESWGVPALETSDQQRELVRGMYHVTKAIDPHRLCVGNDGWEHLVTDLLTVHDYAQRGDTLAARYGDRASLARTIADVQPGYRPIVLPGAPVAGLPVVISELGGVSLDMTGTAGWHGYGSVRASAELVAAYADLVGALIDSPAVAGFCWTQLTDTGEERNGLLTADRLPKADIARIREITTRLAASVPADATNDDAYPHPRDE